MKKVIMMLAAVAMAIGAQAGETKWYTVKDMDAMGIYSVGPGALSENNVRTTLDTISASAILTTTLMEDSWSEQLSNIQAGLLTSSMDLGGGEFFYGADAGNTYFAFLATYDDANLTPGGSFKVYIAEVTAQTSSIDLSEATLYATGKFGGGSELIPEPTSGLMLLLGLAGLALKRKVA